MFYTIQLHLSSEILRFANYFYKIHTFFIVFGIILSFYIYIIFYFIEYEICVKSLLDLNKNCEIT